MTIKLALGCLLCCMLASCATMLNTKITKVHIYTESPAAIIYNSDTLKTDNIDGFNAVTLEALRSKDSLRFSITNDSLTKEMAVKPRISSTIYLNVFSFGFVGAGIDLISDRKYAYKSPLFITNDLTLNNSRLPKMWRQNRVKRDKMLHAIEYKKDWGLFPNRGDCYLNIAFPFVYIGISNIKPFDSPRDHNGGLFGFAMGFDYYYQKRRFLNLSTDFSLIGFLGESIGDYDNTNNLLWTFSLTHNHRFRYFSFGYGLSYAVNNWKHTIEETYTNELISPSRYYFREKNKFSTLGLSLNAYAYFSKNFYAGVIYRPQFIRLKPGSHSTFTYDHLISIDFAFKIRLNKRK